MPAAPRVHALVLAAGAARRFGADKLLATYRGRPLAAAALATVAELRSRGSIADGHVVVRSADHPVAALAREAGLQVVVAADADEGLAASLAAGLAALPADADAAAVVLADQPLVSVDAVEALLRTWIRERPPVVRPVYADRPDEPGHPVILDRSGWGAAAGVRGDVGLGRILAASGAVVRLVELPGANPDVDTQADLHNLEESTR